MRTVGFELEMSDIKTADAALIVYKDLALWKDRWGQYSKPSLVYDRWHLQSDGSIRNSDGTRCMTTFLNEEGQKVLANPSKKSVDRLQWKGAELISPVFTLEDTSKLETQFETMISAFFKKGAFFSKALYDSLHIHVDVSDCTEEEMMHWMPQIANCQLTLNSLGNGWPKRNMLTPPELTKFEMAAQEGVESFKEQLVRTKEGKVKFWDHDDVRRIVDMSHRYREDRPNTIEFRSFSAIPTWSYIEESAELAVWLVEQWKEKVPYKDYYLILKEKANKIKELDDLYHRIRMIGTGR
jgi:hypothetical protein